MNSRVFSERWLNEWIFFILAVLCAGLLAYLSLQYRFYSDWTVQGRNTLSERSRQLLHSLDKPLVITAWTGSDAGLADRIHSFLQRYSRTNPAIELRFRNPDLYPELSHNLGLTLDGELVIEYDGRRENVRRLAETGITNAIYRLMNPENLWVVFLSGHGERSPLGHRNHDYGEFATELRNRGLNLLELDLSTTRDIPDNTGLLVMAGVEGSVSADEIAIISEYLERGGNLLWLQDPGRSNDLDPVAIQLGIQFLPGTVVDGASRAHGVKNPTMLATDSYPQHPINVDFHSVTLFPGNAAIDTAFADRYEVAAIVKTSSQSWTESGPIRGTIQFDPNSTETEGPLTTAVSLRAPVKGSEELQRIVVIGDEDFVADQYIANGDNLEFGIRVVQWLIQGDRQIQISPRDPADRKLDISEMQLSIISLTFLLILPAGFIAGGLYTGYRRKNL